MNNAFVRIFVGTIIGFLLVIALTRVVNGAPLAPTSFACRYNTMSTQDMAGRYLSDDMYLEVGSCGTFYLQWYNRFGAHDAYYQSFDRLVGHGIVGVGFEPDPMSGTYLDAHPLLAVKAAEPGYIQIASMASNGEVFRVYRLRKLS